MKKWTTVAESAKESIDSISSPDKNYSPSKNRRKVSLAIMSLGFAILMVGITPFFLGDNSADFFANLANFGNNKNEDPEDIFLGEDVLPPEILEEIEMSRRRLSSADFHSDPSDIKVLDGDFLPADVDSENLHASASEENENQDNSNKESEQSGIFADKVEQDEILPTDVDSENLHASADENENKNVEQDQNLENLIRNGNETDLNKENLNNLHAAYEDPEIIISTEKIEFPENKHTGNVAEKIDFRIKEQKNKIEEKAIYPQKPELKAAAPTKISSETVKSGTPLNATLILAFLATIFFRFRKTKAFQNI